MYFIIVAYYILTAVTLAESDTTIVLSKKLPTNRRFIGNISSGDYIYVDKTRYALDLIESDRFYFLSRPRKFGKTHFLDTLEKIFCGEKRLFVGSEIYKSDYPWFRFPVLRFDFSRMNTTKCAKNLKATLKTTILKMSRRHRVRVSKSLSFPTQLEELVAKVARKSTYKEVVVLVDEYDHPIIKNLDQPDVAEEMRLILTQFFDVLKRERQLLRFVFVTGVSKISITSAGSRNNFLHDLTTDPKFATIMGYTEDEYKSNFRDYIGQVAGNRSTRNEAVVVNETRSWYGGYRFSKSKLTVHNPWSVLNYLERRKAGYYWSRLSRNTSLILLDEIRKYPSIVVRLITSTICKSRKAFSEWISSVEKGLPLIAFMYQIGYLTFRQFNAQENCYELDFPNKEVREGFYNSVLVEFVGCDIRTLSQGVERVRQSVTEFTFEAFVEQMNVFFKNSSTPLMVEIADVGEETACRHVAVLIILEYCFPKSISAEDECATVDADRSEIVVNLTEAIYVFDLKCDDELSDFEERDASEYGVRFHDKSKPTVVVRINFNSRYRNIDDWRGVLVRGEEVVRKFHSEMDEKSNTVSAVTSRNSNDERSASELPKRARTTYFFDGLLERLG